MTMEEVIAALIVEGDTWLTACVLYTVGDLELLGLKAEVQGMRDSTCPLIRESAHLSWQRLLGRRFLTDAHPKPYTRC